MSRKRIIALSLPLLSLICSCSSSLVGENEALFWHCMGHDKTATVQNVVDAYAEKYKDLGETVRQQSQGGTYDDLATKLVKAIPAGTNPTLAFCYPDNVADYIAANHAVIKLDDFINNEEYGFKEEDGYHTDASGNKKVGKDDYISGYWNEGTQYAEEGTWSVPFYKSTEVMFYNKTRFDQNGLTVPTTWEELVALGNRLKGTEFNRKYGFGYDSDSNLVIGGAVQRGIPYTVQSETGDHYKFNNTDFVNMCDEFANLIKAKTMCTKDTLETKTYTSTLFTDEDIWITIGSTGGTSYNVSGNFEVGVAPVPCLSTVEPRYIQQGPSICIFSNTTQKQREIAWKFYKMCTNTTYGTSVALQNNYDPVRISSHESTVFKNYIQKDELFAKVEKVVSNFDEEYYTTPAFTGSANCRNQVGNILKLITQSGYTAQDAVTYAENHAKLGA